MPESKAIVPVALAPLSAPAPASLTTELEDAFADDSLEMNETGDKFRVKGARRLRRIIGVSEQQISSTSFTPIAGCQVPIPERVNRCFYYFRALVVWLSSDVAEGMAARITFTGTPFGQHRYRVMMGDTSGAAPTCRFGDLNETPTPLTSGPGPSAFAYQEIEGGFAVDAGASGTLSIEVRAETGGANSVTVKVPTYLEIAIST